MKLIMFMHKFYSTITSDKCDNFRWISFISCCLCIHSEKLFFSDDEDLNFYLPSAIFFKIFNLIVPTSTISPTKSSSVDPGVLK